MIEELDERPEPISDCRKLVVGEFVCGAAGTGKSTRCRERQIADPIGVVFAATTGVSAINLGEGVTTIHSLLWFFDEDSLRDRYFSGRLTSRLVMLMKQEGMRELCIDEISMFSGEALDILWKAIEEAAERAELKEPFRLSLIGDFLQLGPINAAKWAYEADMWEPEIAPNVTKLEKVWRQTDPTFLAAMAAARRGDGAEAAHLLAKSGTQFGPAIRDDFPGATLVGTNDEVNRYNFLRLSQLSGSTWAVRSERWTISHPGIRPPSEWKHVLEEDRLRKGAVVMLKANDVPSSTTDPLGVGWRYANGDLGEVLDFDPNQGWLIRIRRTGVEVVIGRIKRTMEARELPDGWPKDRIAANAVDGKARLLPYKNTQSGKWVLGELIYFPIRLAYAITVASSQGVTLDNVQINMRGHWLGAPANAYVALSRCRTPEGLRIVGDEALVARRVRVHEKARPWI